MRRELVNVANNGRQIVLVSQEPADANAGAEESADAAAWECSVAAMPEAERAKAVSAVFLGANREVRAATP